jgi:hypothetical protein
LEKGRAPTWLESDVSGCHQDQFRIQKLGGLLIVERCPLRGRSKRCIRNQSPDYDGAQRVANEDQSGIGLTLSKCDALGVIR